MSSTTPGSEPERPHDGELSEQTASEPDAAVHDESEPPAAPAASEPEPAPAPAPEPEPAPEPFVAPEPDSAPDIPDAAEPPAWVQPDGTADSVEPAHSATPEDSAEPAEPVEPAEAAAPVEPAASPDATARLDEAVQRANAAPAASDLDDTGESGDVPEPIAADSVRRETYVPSATVAAGTAAGAATLAPEPDAVYVAPQPGPQTVYVQAPTPPKSRGNRAFGVLVALVGAVLFALLYAGVAYLLLLGQTAADEATSVFAQFVTRPVYWVPIVAFFLFFTILAAIVNRGGWWYYAVFGLIVAALVYFSYLGGALLTVEAWTLTVDEARDFISQRWLDPFAIVAFIIAREIPIWLGGWIAARGRTVTERNRVAIEEYDRELAAGPQAQR